MVNRKRKSFKIITFRNYARTKKVMKKHLEEKQGKTVRCKAEN